MGDAIFFSLDHDKLFDSTYDDIWEIKIPNDLVYYEDSSMKFPMAYTNQPIPKKYIKLIQKGTGEDTF